jgi:hypothetical protein
MTKRVLDREQRREVEGCLSVWGEWSRNGGGGFASAQWSSVPAGEFGSSVLVPPAVDAVESVLQVMSQEYPEGRRLVIWLWLEANASLTKVERCRCLQVHKSTFERWEDKTYCMVWDGLIDFGLIAGKKIAA